MFTGVFSLLWSTEKQICIVASIFQRTVTSFKNRLFTLLWWLTLIFFISVHTRHFSFSIPVHGSAISAVVCIRICWRTHDILASWHIRYIYRVCSLGRVPSIPSTEGASSTAASESDRGRVRSHMPKGFQERWNRYAVFRYFIDGDLGVDALQRITSYPVW